MNVGLILEPTGAHLSHYWNALRDMPEVTAVHAVDPSGVTAGQLKEALAQKLAGFHRSVPEMLQAAAPPITLISLEAHHAPPAIAACLEAGSHVLAEKPSCVRLKDFEELAAIAHAGKRQLLLAFANRGSPIFEDARRIIREGHLGRLYGMQVQAIADQTRLQKLGSNPNWFFRKDQGGGGHLIWLGIHWIDLIHHICATSIVEVSAFAGVVGGAAVDVEDSAALVFRCDNGMHGSMLSAYYLNRANQDFTGIWGERGWIWLRPAGENRLVWCSGDPGDKPPPPQTISYEGRTVNAYSAFVHAAIRAAAGASEFPLTTRDSLQALRVVFTAYESARTGRSLPVAQALT